MPRKYIASYNKLARKRGHVDPLQYLWEQYEAQRKLGNDGKATELALILLPYGHGRQAPRDKENETVTPGVFKLE